MTAEPLAVPVVAVTGANGYVGSVITKALRGRAKIVDLVRRPPDLDQIAWSFDSTAADIARQLSQRGVTHLIHAAWDMSTSSLSELKSTCVDGSRRLLEAAKIANVNRIIFLSTISAFDGASSAYGRSKLEVEDMVRREGGITLRLGLVHGDGDGGVYGTLRRAVKKSVVPLIGSGRQPQYLLSETLLSQVICQAVDGSLMSDGKPITLADPTPISFRSLLLDISKAEGCKPLLVPVPWVLIYSALKSAESLGLRPAVRSDSVLSFVFQDPKPDFSYMEKYLRGTGAPAASAN